MKNTVERYASGRIKKTSTKKYDVINRLAKEKGYDSVGKAMVDPEFVEEIRKIKNKNYKIEPDLTDLD